MGGGIISDAKLIAAGYINEDPIKSKGFYSLDWFSYTEIIDSSFNERQFEIKSINYNNSSDQIEPKWVVVGSSPNIDTSYLGLYSINGIDWTTIQDNSFFWNDSLNNGYSWNGIASDHSKNWIAVGQKASSSPVAITTNSINIPETWEEITINDVPNNNSSYRDIYYQYLTEKWLCVGQRNDDSTGNLPKGGVWETDTSNIFGTWSPKNDVSFLNYGYNSFSSNSTEYLLVVGSDSSGFNTNGVGTYFNGVSWDDISDVNLNANDTIWESTSYSPVNNRWTIVGTDLDFTTFNPKGKIIYNTNQDDLTSWSAATINILDPTEIQRMIDVVWDNNLNKFFAVGIIKPDLSNNAIILDSSDGIIWEKSGSSYDDIDNLIFNGIATSSPNLF